MPLAQQPAANRLRQSALIGVVPLTAWSCGTPMATTSSLPAPPRVVLRSIAMVSSWCPVFGSWRWTSRAAFAMMAMAASSCRPSTEPLASGHWKAFFARQVHALSSSGRAGGRSGWKSAPPSGSTSWRRPVGRSGTRAIWTALMEQRMNLEPQWPTLMQRRILTTQEAPKQETQMVSPCCAHSVGFPSVTCTMSASMDSELSCTRNAWPST
mmetsp:Transcript_24932/g.71772  ORF Transcript_24932/g.71772 Transcript_24932/m.71772 type:complete len:211 (-) Transcript_24932:427-1059(-)